MGEPKIQFVHMLDGDQGTVRVEGRAVCSLGVVANAALLSLVSK